MTLDFRILARHENARNGVLRTAHGDIQTPVFMPVGTMAAVKSVLPSMLVESGSQIILANAYHLSLRPGIALLKRFGGIRQFMGWKGPLLTDSGGFQLMSLAGFCQIAEQGVNFRSYRDGSRHFLSPESIIRMQYDCDVTLSMVLDECVALPADYARLAEAMRRSLRWAQRCRQVFCAREGYGIFGIVQGGTEPDLRAESACGLVDIGFDGYAIGGLATGEPQAVMLETLSYATGLLPESKPRYLMGVGTPDDMLRAILLGVDMFDCVLPTRSGRTGRAYTSHGVLNLRNARHAEADAPLDEACACPACRNFSRAYLRHLVQTRELLAPLLLSLHNLFYFHRVFARVRQAINAGNLNREIASIRAGWAESRHHA